MIVMIFKLIIHTMQIYLIIVLIQFVTKANASILSSKSQIEQVNSCLREIVKNNFKLNPLGFIILTKTHNLFSPANEIQDTVFKIILTGNETAAMIIGNDREDDFWKTKGDMSSKETQSQTAVGSDELNIVRDEESQIIQSHVRFIRETDYYIIIIDGIRTYNSKIRQILKVPSWNPKAPILIYCSKPTFSEERMLLYPTLILGSLWSYHAMNVTLMMHDWKDASKINIFSWNPYDPPKRCGEKDQNVTEYVELYDTCIYGNLTKKTPLFKEKLPKNLMGCPIKVLGVIWRPFLNHNESTDDAGLDRDIINVIANRLNFTIDLNTENDEWGDVNPDGSWYGMMGDLKKGKGEVGIGAIYPDNDVHEDFDATDSYLQDYYVWVVPRAREVPDWENLIIVLSPTMWIVSLIFYLICSVVWYFLSQSCWEHGIKIKTLVYSMLDSLCMYVGESVTSKPNSDSMRIFFAIFCLYGVIWGTAYQTKLIDILTTPIYEHQITTTDELLKSDLKFGGNEALKFLFNNSIDETEDELHSNYLSLDIHEVLDHVIMHRNVSILTSKLYIEYLSSMTTHFNDYYGNPRFYLLHTTVFSFPVEIVTVKGFVFLRKFNEIISLIKSNGILKRIYHNFLIRCQKRIANLVRLGQIPVEDADIALTLGHLQSAFIVVILGNLIAFLVFIFEIFIYKRNNGKLKINKRSYKFFKSRESEINKNKYDVLKQLKLNKYYSRFKFIRNMHWFEDDTVMERIKGYENIP